MSAGVKLRAWDSEVGSRGRAWGNVPADLEVPLEEGELVVCVESLTDPHGYVWFRVWIAAGEDGGGAK